MPRGRKPKYVARCPEPTHADAHVAAHGTFETSLGQRRRFRCTPKAGDPHTFALIVGPVPLPVHSPAPECPEHEGSTVVRNGTYSTSTVKKRQLYLCTPAGGAAHSFVPKLARDHVHTGVDSCTVCEELRGTHRGDRTVARRHSWSARVVAEALKDLAEGKSYAAVSREVRRATGRTRTRASSKPAGGKVRYAGTALSANAWHTAADWVEAFSPVLWDDLEPRLREADRQARERNDTTIAAGGRPTEPMVLLLDDIPVEVRGRKEYFVLVAAQVEWVPTPGAAEVLGRQVRLRLLRGYPSNAHHAWKLLLHELGYQPDFVLADRGKGLVKAVTEAYGGQVPVLPSLFHLREAVEKALLATPGARRAGAKRTVNTARLLEPSLEAHVRGLRRSSLTTMTAQEWSAWWDQLERLLVGLRLPLEKVARRRRNYEQLVADLLPTYRAYPQLPVSTGGLEVALRQRVGPVLRGRKHAFANLERVNRLFDLVVCRDWGVFDDTLAVAELIRADNETNDGWATPLREVVDVRTGSSRYSSLRDQQLLRTRARKEGLL